MKYPGGGGYGDGDLGWRAVGFRVLGWRSSCLEGGWFPDVLGGRLVSGSLEGVWFQSPRMVVSSGMPAVTVHALVAWLVGAWRVARPTLALRALVAWLVDTRRAARRAVQGRKGGWREKGGTEGVTSGTRQVMMVTMVAALIMLMVLVMIMMLPVVMLMAVPLIMLVITLVMAIQW